jgi:hypothetical protein
MLKPDANASNVILFPSERARRPAPEQPCVVDWRSWYHQDEVSKSAR